MPEQDVETVRCKYVFVDICEFTKGRSVEAQAALVTALNSIVLESVSSLSVAAREILYLPTGDGICIALLDDPSFDIHLRLATGILGRLDAHNNGTTAPMRRFQVRIGLNENIDNVVTDINGHRNLAGAGINHAQRVMSEADPNQVMLGQSVHEVLNARERYMKTLRSFQSSDKHGQRMAIYQFVRPGIAGLDTAIPIAFRKHDSLPPKLTETVAYYMADAINHRDDIRSLKDEATYEHVVCCLLYLRALDQSNRAAAGEHGHPMDHTWESGVASFVEQYKHYNDSDFWLCANLEQFIIGEILSPFSDYFEQADGLPVYVYVNETGRARLAAAFPSLLPSELPGT